MYYQQGFAFSLARLHAYAIVRPIMSLRSDIEWTDATWNPVRGCSKVSPGCAHCYAETFAERFRGVIGHPYEHGFDLRLLPERLLDPLRWRRPRVIFVNSMSDLFHERVPNVFIESVALVMERANWHTYQVLTKRSERMRMLLGGLLRGAADAPHVWWGVSVENRHVGLPRILDLQHANARVRFLSIEPLLEDLGQLDLGGVSWVIVGGESGAGARPMKRDWVASLHRQCQAMRIPFFFKQWGGFRKNAAGRELYGETHDQRPVLIRSAPPDHRRWTRLLEDTADTLTSRHEGLSLRSACEAPESAVRRRLHAG